jgi:hypothetical protein
MTSLLRAPVVLLGLGLLIASCSSPSAGVCSVAAMGTWKLTNNRQFYVGVTNRRLLLSEPNTGVPLRAYSRAETSIKVMRKKWVDQGNTTIRTTHGWEVELRLPPGEAYTLRLHPYYQAASAAAFAKSLGVA